MGFSILRVLAYLCIISGIVVFVWGLYLYPFPHDDRDGFLRAGIILVMLFLGIPLIGTGVLMFIAQRIKQTTKMGKIAKWGFSTVAIFIFFGVVSAWMPERIFLKVIEIFPSVSTCRVFESPLFSARHMIAGSSTSQTCFVYVGVFHSDPTLCKNLPWYWNDECYQLIAQKEQDPSLCKHMIAYDGGRNCYGRVAIAVDDIELCKAIGVEGSSNYDECVTQVQRHDCSYQKGGALEFPNHDGCYSSLAVAEKDVRICENIVFRTQKLLCRAIFR